MAEWTKNCNGNYGSSYVLKLVATENSTSTTNNTSSVTTKLYIKANTGYAYYGFTNYGSISINGTNYDTETNQSTVSASDWVLLSSRTNGTVVHNTDGSKTITVSGTFDTTYGNLTSTSISASFQLTKIPRYFSQTPTMTISDITETGMTIAWATSETCKKVIAYWKISGTNNWGTGQELYNNSTGATSGSGSITGLNPDTNYDIKITCTRKDSSLDSDSVIQVKATYPYPYISVIGTPNIVLPSPAAESGTLTQELTIYNPRGLTGITVYAKKDSPTGTLFISKGSVSGTSVTLSFTNENVLTMYTSIPSSTNGNIVYYCETGGNVSTRIAGGSFSTTANNCKPVLANSLSYTNLTDSALIGSDTIIQGHSSFRIACPEATVLGGAIIKDYYFKIGDADYEANSTKEKDYASTLLKSNVTISAYVKDSRGYNSDVISTTMRIVPYSVPTATCSIKRTGYTTNGTVIISATRTDLTNSSNASVNKWTGDSTNHKVFLTISPSGPSFGMASIGTTEASFTNAQTTISNLVLGQSYVVTVDISDELTTRTLSFPIEKASGLLALMDDCDAVGINVIPELTNEPGLYVNGISNVTGNSSVGGNFSVTGGAEVGGAAHISGATYTDALYINGIKTIWWE